MDARISRSNEANRGNHITCSSQCMLGRSHVEKWCFLVLSHTPLAGWRRMRHACAALHQCGTLYITRSVLHGSTRYRGYDQTLSDDVVSVHRGNKWLFGVKLSWGCICVSVCVCVCVCVWVYPCAFACLNRNAQCGMNHSPPWL